MKLHTKFFAVLLIIAGSVTFSYGATAYRVLVFTRVAAGLSSHASIPAGIQCIRDIAAKNGFAVDTSNDTLAITGTNLAKYSTVVFLNTGGTIFGTAQEQAFSRYMEAGGGWIGIHYASDCETNWPWYGGLLGNNAWRSGQVFGNFVHIRENKDHFIVRSLPDTLSLGCTEEYYGFKNNPRSAVTVLYHCKQTDAADHPSMWCHEYDGGRAVYAVCGHNDTTFRNAAFQAFMTNAIIWASHKDGARAERPAAVSQTTVASVSIENLRNRLEIRAVSGDVTVCVDDVKGRALGKSSVSARSPLVIAGLGQGIYMVSVRTEKGQFAAGQRVVVAR
jgi:type 1 glutamine amidotransferase